MSRPKDDIEFDERHKKLYSNFDKINPESNHEQDAEHRGEIHKVVHSNHVTCSFSPHFMSRMDHKDEHTGDDMENEKYNPHRRIGKTGQLVPHSSVKIHIRKIIKHISESDPSDEHMPTKRNQTTAVMYKHKPTDQDILVHLHHNPAGGKPHASFETYAGNQPFNAFANKNRPNNNKSEKPRTEKRITLESLLKDRIETLMEEKFLYIHRVELA